jgi:cell division septum initiation protein DivIVA
LSPLSDTTPSIDPAAGFVDADDAVLVALDELVGVLNTISETRDRITERAQHIRSRRASHVPYSIIVPEEERPLIVERARASLSDLVEAAGRLQRAEARALHDEGLSMDRIGSLFGVSRQRVADFLRSP